MNEATQLPPEIWHRVLIYTEDPKPLSQTHKSLHTLCLNPLSISKWLFQRYKSEALLGALWHWNRKKQWRQWIENVSTHADMRSRNSATFRGYALNLYDQNWFETEKKGCSRCNGYGRRDGFAFDHYWYQEINDPLDAMKTACQNYINQHFCSLEKHQFAVCKNLIEWGVPFDTALPLLLRFAATKGHPRLLKYLISLGTSEATHFDFGDQVFEEVIIQGSHHRLVRQLLGDAMQKRQILISYMLIRSSVMHGMRQIEWNQLMLAMMEDPPISLSLLFLEENTRTKVKHVVRAIKNSCVPFPFARQKTRTRYRIISRRMIETLSTAQLQEDEPLLALICSESGRDDLIRYLKAKNVTFNHFDNSCLFQAVVFGHVNAVHVLLYECNVSTMIYQNGRSFVFSILLIDHFLLLGALITSFFSFVNEFICRRLQLGGPSIVLFGFYGDTRWCIQDNLNDPFGFSSFVVFTFFGMIYFGLSTVVSIFPLLRCMYKVHRKQRSDRKVIPTIREMEELPYFRSSTTLIGTHSQQ
jgi:hypothetical protein